MLSPNNRIVLLPQDREVMDITGMSEAEYRWFVRECIKNHKLRPGEPVALGFWATVGIQLVIGILLTAASTLLTPKPKDNESKGAEEETIEGQNVVRRDRFTPKSGFDSFQNVVDMGSVIPIVYCKREDVEGKAYGGLRVNTNLLWSQILSVGGGQFFRGVFLVGEGPVELDYAQLALGNNTLASYELPPASEDAEAGRATVYYAPTGGRIDRTDRVLGVVSAHDPGALVGDPGDPDVPADVGDIYQVVGTTDFCQALQPSNQTEFGLYDHIGNNFGYKIGEDFLAVTQWQTRSDGEYERQNSNQKVAEGSKNSVRFTTRAGVKGSTNKLDTFIVGQEFDYIIHRTTEYERTFTEAGSTSGNEQPSVVNCNDIATTIASIQRTFDERINIGDVYKLGSAVVICVDRGDSFVSDVDYDDDGTEVVAKFRVLQAGSFHQWDEDTLDFEYDDDDERESVGTLCSKSSQMFRMLVGAFSVERAFQVIEVGLQSNVGLKTSGIVNFNSLETLEFKYACIPSVEDGSYLAYVSAEYCGGQDGGGNCDDMKGQDESYRKDIRAGTYSGSDTRFSFFRVFVKDIDDNVFAASNNLYAVRSVTGVDVYNYLRFTFPTSKRREFKFVPMSSWEIRHGIEKQTTAERGWDGLYAVDPHTKTAYNITENGFTLSFVGEEITNPSEEFKVKAFLPEGAKEFEVCTDRDIVTRTDVVAQGTGYTAGATGTITYGSVKVMSTTNSGMKMNVSITVSRPSNSVGFVTGVSVPNKPSIGNGSDPDWAPGDTFQMVDENDIGGGSGFVGSVGSIGVETTCVTKQGTSELGFSNVDDDESYVDKWARVAEAFIYDEVTTTATQPEHRISYVNIISENVSEPKYDEMAIVGLNISSSKELRSLDQLSVYCTEGVIPYHTFPKVFEDLLTNPRYGVGEFFSAQQIDSDSFEAAHQWTTDRKYFYDGAISEKLNLRGWGAERARDFLLDLSVSGGKYTLNPVLNFDGPEPIAAMFSSGNIINDTLAVNYLDTQDRLDPIVTVRWREERANDRVFEGKYDKGLFPQIREFSVRRKLKDDGITEVSENAPVIQVDLSNFCTNRTHAEDRAKLECQSKRYITHAVSFKTTPTEAGVQAGSIIKLGIETINYEQPQNGAISNTGEVTSWPPLSDGTYDVIIWDGKTLDENAQLTVLNGRSATYKNAVFCRADSNNRADTYKVTSVSFDEEGNVEIEALYWPTTDSGESLMTVDWYNNGAWNIDG